MYIGTYNIFAICIHYFFTYHYDIRPSVINSRVGNTQHSSFRFSEHNQQHNQPQDRNKKRAKWRVHKSKIMMNRPLPLNKQGSDMSAQPNETENGASRKRPHEPTLQNDDGNGLMNNDEPAPARPAQEPRLMGINSGQSHQMGQFLPNMNAHHQFQGNVLFGQAPQAQASVPFASALPMAPAPQNGLVLAQPNQPASAPANNMMAMYPQQNQNAATGIPSLHQQANVADLVRQALVQAHNQNTQIAPTAPPFVLPNTASAPYQAQHQVPSLPINHNNMVLYHQNQNHAVAPFSSQSYPAMMQPAMQSQQVPSNPQPGNLCPLGMNPQDLLNYAVWVNILHNSTAQGNTNVLTNVLNQPQVQNQEQMNQMVQPTQQGIHGILGLSNHVAAAALSQPNQSAAQPIGLALTSSGDANSNARISSLQYEHTVSPSIPSESNFNTGLIPRPSHVIEAQKIDPQTRCVPLWTHQDEARLSTQQCWLRKQIETFPASQRDVMRHTRGRNRVLKLGQVGIQCIHCKNLPQEGRGKGSSYFLSSTKGIYQAAQNILAYHFKEDTCPIISKKLLQEMKDAGSSGCPRHLAPKAGKSRSGGGKSFWEDSAVHITGLVDTTVGIRYSDDRQNYRPLDTVTLGMTESSVNGANFFSSESVLVSYEDKDAVTDFCFLVMAQFIPFADNTHKSSSEYGDREEDDLNKEDDEGRLGIACRFCKGVSHEGKHRDGVFLSIKPSTMMRNKQLTKLHNHILACRSAPDDLKRAVYSAKEMHTPQNDQLKRGWKKVFFEKVSHRLKIALDAQAAGELSGGETSSLSGSTPTAI
jgi:hypothetical protein